MKSHPSLSRTSPFHSNRSDCETKRGKEEEEQEGM